MTYKAKILDDLFEARHNSASQVGSVAQSVEQRTFNPLVPSSNLGRPTTALFMGRGALAQLVEQRTLNP